MHDASAVYWSQVGGWVVGGIHMFISYNQGKWKQKAFARIELLHPELAGQEDQIRQGKVISN
jgi:hypothetical protein